MTRHAAVDLGASGGRVIVGEVGPDHLALHEVSRFPNGAVPLPDGLHWDVLALYRACLDGLARAGDVTTIGVDSWAVDYGLLDESGALLGNPHHYRDQRTETVADKVHGRMPFEQLYEHTGLQFLPFTTIYQLAAAEGTPQLRQARTLLLIPDLITYWLTGVVGAELTNASTTGLLDVRSHEWCVPVLQACGVTRALLPPLLAAGEPLGPLVPALRSEIGGRATVVAVGSHDTASAVVAVPMDAERSAYISLGTWGLVGVELEQPVLTAASREANFTNELGVDGRVRYLRNVMGLWLLQECLRSWPDADLPALLAAAAERPRGPVFDVDDARLLPPGDMPTRIRRQLAEAGQPSVEDRAALVRCIVDSLADALARAVADAARLSGRDVRVVHVVGGGAQNELLCQLLADSLELPVVAGPVEATAMGNVLAQARSHGTLVGDLEELRGLVRETQPLRRFEPRR
ncbi:MAG: rhamnulokinase [Actinomycetota bacterium]|jgi:rhamnulokinase|nr:rhamnulokinase [Actinomycetota bacterium]